MEDGEEPLGLVGGAVGPIYTADNHKDAHLLGYVQLYSLSSSSCTAIIAEYGPTPTVIAATEYL